MRRALPLGFSIVVLLAAQASAEDFTGAYAGVNAGYGFERGRDGKASRATLNQAPAASSSDLPPSAAVAAKSLQQGRPAAPR